MIVEYGASVGLAWGGYGAILGGYYGVAMGPLLGCDWVTHWVLWSDWGCYGATMGE